MNNKISGIAALRFQAGRNIIANTWECVASRLYASTNTLQQAFTNSH